MYAGCAGKTVRSLENACHTWVLRGVITTRCYTNPSLPLPLPLPSSGPFSGQWAACFASVHDRPLVPPTRSSCMTPLAWRSSQNVDCQVFLGLPFSFVPFRWGGNCLSFAASLFRKLCADFRQNRLSFIDDTKNTFWSLFSGHSVHERRKLAYTPSTLANVLYFIPKTFQLSERRFLITTLYTDIY